MNRNSIPVWTGKSLLRESGRGKGKAHFSLAPDAIMSAIPRIWRDGVGGQQMIREISRGRNFKLEGIVAAVWQDAFVSTDSADYFLLQSQAGRVTL
jgi:hypothetical protein